MLSSLRLVKYPDWVDYNIHVLFFDKIFILDDLRQTQ